MLRTAVNVWRDEDMIDRLGPPKRRCCTSEAHGSKALLIAFYFLNFRPWDFYHFIDLEWMKEAYRLTRKDGALGIDGVTAAV